MDDDKVKTEAAAVAVEASKSHGNKGGPRYVLSSLRYWDVLLSHTKRYMLAGRFVPSVRGAALPFFTKKRRITIELYTPAPPEVQVDNHNDEQTNKLFGQLLKGISSSSLMQVGVIGDNDLVAFRILKPKRHNEPDSGTHDGDWDSHSIGSMSMSTLGFGASSDDVEFDTKNTRWKERYRCRLDTLEIISQKGKACDLKLGAESSAILKTINFESHHDVQTFFKVLNQMTRLREERARRLANSYKEMHVSRPGPRTSPSIGSVSPLSVDEATHSNKFPAGGDSSKELSPQIPNRATEKVATITVEGQNLEHSAMDEANLEIDTMDEGNNVNLESKTAFSESTDVEAPLDNRIQLLIEIVSASNLPVADILSSDPYIKVFDGGKEIHRTKVISKTLNPVWTVATKSLFLINTTIENYFTGSNFITFEVKDYDAFKKNNTMGTVEISKDNILKGTGERIDFDILPPGKGELKRKMMEGSSTLALRFREATPRDVAFMESLLENEARNLSGVYASETFLPQRDHRNPIMKRTSRKGKNHFKEYRVKPFPDPDRRSETAWLTKKDIHEEASKPSKYWIESGSGDVGKVYVEVLWCDKLPNLDFSVTGRDKTDAFACLVFEDCVVNTDVINDCLSPRWLPWAQRAFVLNIRHPSSQIMVGVFDQDSGLAHSRHDFVGRTVVNLTNLRPGTLHTRTYVLYDSPNEERAERGTITLRLRVELPNARKALLAGMLPVLHHDVSVAEREHFRVVHHTITHGEHPGVLSLSFISSYVQELQSYLGVAFYLQPAIATVLLWRGHFPVTFRVPFPSRNDHQDRRRCIERWTRLVTIRLPLHSMILFGWGVSLAKNLDLLPSFLVFCIGWFLLLTMEIARNRPSALYRPKSYVELMRVLILNQAGGPMSIKPDENLEQIMAFNEKQAELRKARDEVIKMIEMEQKMYETYIEAQTSCLEEEVDITTKARGDLSSFTLAPFRGLLLPLQQILHGICIILRVTKSVIVWRDSYVSFWIVTACFVASFILVWIPWAFLLSWTFKIIVWGLLGPWMKLLDIFYFRRIQSGEEQQKQDLAQKFRERYTMLIGESLFRKRRKETALKMKDMKKYMFGQFLLRVPVFKEERFFDDPLPSSFADPFDNSMHEEIQIIDRKLGQHLEGEMIPQRQDKNVLSTVEGEGEVSMAKRSVLSSAGLRIDETEPLLIPKLEEDYGSTTISNTMNREKTPEKRPKKVIFFH